MQFMDVVVAVLAKLREDRNPFICEEEIEDLYCYKIQALILIKRRYWARTIGEEIRHRRTRRAAEEAVTAVEKAAAATKAATEEAAAKQTAVADAAAMQRAAAKAAAEQEAAAASERVTEVAAVAAEAKLVRIEGEELQADARNQECCRAATKAEFLRAIKSPPVLKTIPKPKRKTNHLVTVEIHLRRKLKAIRSTKQQKRSHVLLEITKTKRNLKPIENALEMNYAAASPRVPAIEDWYNFEEEEDYEFHDALDSHEPDANAEHKDKATLTKDDDDWLSEEIQEEVRKLEQLAKQLDEVVTPAIQAKPGPLELNTQQIKEFTEERKPLELESAKESMENSTEVASILIPTKAVPNIIPPKQPPPVRDRSRSMCKVRGCKRHFRGCRVWRNHSGPCEGVLDIGYLCIQPRAWMRVPRTTTVPIYGPPVGTRASRTIREAHRLAGVPGWRRVSDRSTPWAG